MALRVRVIEYTLKDSATPVQDSYRLVTNILDPEAAPVLELAALYHERWEIEGVFDEIKTHMRSTSTPMCQPARGVSIHVESSAR